MAMISLCLRKGRIIAKTVLEGVWIQTEALPSFVYVFMVLLS